jgi:surface antigen
MIKKFYYSQALLAVAIAFLAFSLFRFSLHIPAVINAIKDTTDTVDLVSPQIDSIVNEIELVRIEVSKVRTLVQQQTPDILSQVAATLPVVEQVILESKNYSRQIPALLDKLSSIEQQVASLQTSLPEILKRVDVIVKTMDNTMAEIALWRPHSTQYLEEIKRSRDYIPKYLSRIENTVIDAKTVGAENTRGLVSGFVEGVISLPFEVVAGLTGIVDINSHSAKYLTAKDVALMQEKIVSLLNDSNQSKSVWQNVDSGNRGTIIKSKMIKRNKQECYSVSFNNHFGNNKEKLKELMCQDNKGLWKVM